MTRAGSTGTPEEPGRDPSDEEEPLAPPSKGPPGGRIFSLGGRRAPGLYLVAWVLSVSGAVLLFLAPRASSDLGNLVFIAVGALALLLGLAAAAGSQIVERSDRRLDRYRGAAPLLVFGVVLAATSIVASLLPTSGITDPDAPSGFFFRLLLVAAGYAIAVWLFAVKSGALSWQQMGWPVRSSISVQRVLRSSGIAIAVMMPLTLGILLAGGILATILGVEPPSVLPTPSNSLEALAVALSAVVIAPVGEELFFRGFALTAWLRDLGPRAAIGRSAFFFAILHIIPISTTSFLEGAGQALLVTAAILPLGLVLGWLFVRYGMVGAITGHVTYNAILLLLWSISA